MDNVYIHPTADVSPKAVLGDGVRIWHEAQVREGARLGANCIVGKGAYVDFGVQIGDNVKLQNRASVYHGVTLEDGVFVGPNACFTNDRAPRARNSDWQVTKTLVQSGASIGANATIVCGITIGEYAMIAAGSVVTKDVEPFALVMGNPARQVGRVDELGNSQSDER